LRKKKNKKKGRKMGFLWVPTDLETGVTKQLPLLHGLLIDAIPTVIYPPVTVLPCFKVRDVPGDCVDVGITKDGLVLLPVLSVKLGVEPSVTRADHADVPF
jgi:hypothetical protein